MNSKTLRRLAADHGALHNLPLPPNYLFPPRASDIDDLTQLDILLAGPTHTPFATGVWRLHLTMPATYPQGPPTAHFRTPIFHPNVDAQTGGVCVETLKRDWDVRLTLRDVLVTISCLLIQPNPDSALNAEAGALIQEDFAAFARRAELMTSIHAVVPRDLREAVKEAQMRGQEKVEELESEGEEEQITAEPAAPARRRRVTARQRGAAASRRSEGSPSAAMTMRRRPRLGAGNPFVLQTDAEDPFGSLSDLRPHRDTGGSLEEEDSSMVDADQENDESRSPVKIKSPTKAATPIRPNGTATPLGEMWLEDAISEDSSVDDDDDDDDVEPEYPPSPRKSPLKSPAKHGRPFAYQNSSASPHAESSRMAAARDTNITPPTNHISQPLAEDSPFAFSASPRKERTANPLSTLPKVALFQGARAGRKGGVIPKIDAKPKTSPRSTSSEKRRRKAELDAKLWKLCGGDIRRWNRGQFDGDVLHVKARRW